MPIACTACRHPQVATIDQRLQDGDTARSVAGDYGLSYDALTRHNRNHRGRLVNIDQSVPVPMSNGHEAVRDPLDELVDALRLRALAGDPIVAREYRLALSAMQARQDATAPPLDLVATPEWIALRTAVLQALEPYPEARIAVADALA